MHLPIFPWGYVNTQYISYDLVVNNPQLYSSILCWGELNLGILMSMSAAAFRRCLTLASRQGWGVRQTSNSTAVQAEVKSIVGLLFCRFFHLAAVPDEEAFASSSPVLCLSNLIQNLGSTIVGSCSKVLGQYVSPSLPAIAPELFICFPW